MIKLLKAGCVPHLFLIVVEWRTFGAVLCSALRHCIRWFARELQEPTSVGRIVKLLPDASKPLRVAWYGSSSEQKAASLYAFNGLYRREAGGEGEEEGRENSQYRFTHIKRFTGNALTTLR